MKIVFITNFMTEHQRYLSNCFYNHLDVDYLFLETHEPDDSFQASDCKEDNSGYIVSYDELRLNREKYLNQINDADVVIHGSAPDYLIIKRIKSNKLTFRYLERFYKNGFPRRLYLRNYLASWLHHGRFKNYNLYMLCASAFTSVDCEKFGNYIQKRYKWGYFPKTDVFDIEKTVAEKKTGSIIWASRFIDWKHPEIPVLIAEKLKKDGYDFKLTLYGKGEMFDEISALVANMGLENNVFLDDSKKSDDLREIMKSTSIFLHTANAKEGWGAVINEAMNSGCAVVASHLVGSVPYLIKDNENGVIFEDGNIDDLYNKVKYLLDNPDKTREIGINAYKTITGLWNAEETANRFIALAKSMLSGDLSPDIFAEGPCSRAEIIENDWYKVD